MTIGEQQPASSKVSPNMSGRAFAFTRIVTLIAVASFACACGPTATSSQPKPASSRSDTTCNRDDVSQRAAQLAQAAVPDRLPTEERRQQRNKYIGTHRWELFDQDHDGRMTFDEYLDMEWASYLAQLPEGHCVVTKPYFMIRFLGDPSDPHSFWHLPYQAMQIDAMYAGIDKTNKGYITRDDLRESALQSFSFSDKKRLRYLTREEFP